MTKQSIGDEPEPPHLEGLPELPTTITMADGKQYSVAGDTWILPEDRDSAASVKIDWTLLKVITAANASTPVMSERAVSLTKLYTMERLSAFKCTAPLERNR